LWRITGDAEAAVAAIADELDDPTWAIDAAEALGQMGPAARSALPVLTELSKSETVELDLREAAAEAIEKIDPARVEAQP